MRWASTRSAPQTARGATETGQSVPAFAPPTYCKSVLVTHPLDAWAAQSCAAARCGATIRGRRLTLIDLARAWPPAERVHGPLKALDSLLGNRHLHGERESLHAAMTNWLARNKRPVIVIDWSDLKSDRSWHVLRAAIPVDGRTLTVLDMCSPPASKASPRRRSNSCNVWPACFPMMHTRFWSPMPRVRQVPFAKRPHGRS